MVACEISEMCFLRSQRSSSAEVIEAEEDDPVRKSSRCGGRMQQWH